MDAPLQIPKAVRRPLPQDDDPRYFAVLEAAWRHPDFDAMPFDAPGRYHEVARDEPLANEFRAYFHIDGGMRSIPVGGDREHAEMIVEALNAAYDFGVRQARRVAADPRTRAVLVGRLGHINRDEEQMP